jgi:HPt (histidine-containing phosphotransfer) domain-containing protein
MNENNGANEIVRVDPDYADLVPGFLDNRRLEIDIIRNSAARGDFREIRRLGHGMKGAGAGYGFEVISDIGKNLEEAAINEDVPAIETELLRLGTYLSEVRVVVDTV